MPEPSLASHRPGAGSLREVVRCCIYLPWRSRCATTFGIFSLCTLPLMYFFCVVRLFWAQPRGTLCDRSCTGGRYSRPLPCPCRIISNWSMAQSAAWSYVVGRFKNWHFQVTPFLSYNKDIEEIPTVVGETCNRPTHPRFSPFPSQHAGIVDRTHFRSHMASLEKNLHIGFVKFRSEIAKPGGQRPGE